MGQERQTRRDSYASNEFPDRRELSKLNDIEDHGCAATAMAKDNNIGDGGWGRELNLCQRVMSRFGLLIFLNMFLTVGLRVKVGP